LRSQSYASTSRCYSKDGPARGLPRHMRWGFLLLVMLGRAVSTHEQKTEDGPTRRGEARTGLGGGLVRSRLTAHSQRVVTDYARQIR
jgi:hypothetical protein